MTDFEKYLQEYFDLLPSENWQEELKIVTKRTLEIYQSFTEVEGDFAYAENKWSLKTVLQHLTDTEKIFQYRALRFARKDATPLAGFDENLYAENGSAHLQSLAALLEEFHLTRMVSLMFFDKLTPEQLMQKGTANGNEFSVEIIGKLVVAHNIHHLNIIKERYLSQLNF